MKFVSLLENTSAHAECGCMHGLSLYLETAQHHLLFDMGPNALFLENAEVLGVDIASVDLAFLSHGHYDHGGGLELFCKRNPNAPILMGEGVFDAHAVQAETGTGYRDIGLDTHVQRKYAGRFLHHVGKFDDELTVFSEIPDKDYLTAASASLLEKQNGVYASDRFFHEQNLIVQSEGKSILLAGCAHRGIINILRAGEAILGGEFDYVISGFHLTNPGRGIDEPDALILAVGEELHQRKHTHYITGHCTGDHPYQVLKQQLGEQISAMPVGTIRTL